MREKVIEKNLVDEIKKLGGLCLKFNSQSMVGIPDRIILLNNKRMCFVETKAPNKKLRPLQLITKRKLESLGFKVYVVDTIEKAKEVVDEINST